MAGVGTYWRTLRYLKARQIVGRAVFRLGAAVPSVGATPHRRNAVAAWIPPARCEPSLTGESAFLFLNRHGCLAEGGWDPPGIDKLWRYNLHYFDDLNAIGAEQRRSWHVSLLDRWIRENPPARGTGWEPYPTSLRIVNWIKWLQDEAAVRQDWLDSLFLQSRWLARRLEWHLLGNHLFANAKALVAAGLFFTGSEADALRLKGVSILKRELREQILEDGGQFELSPMYHVLALQDVLDLLVIISRYSAPDAAIAELRAELEEAAPRMLAWACAMSFPDGALPRFNDAAGGIAPRLDELTRTAQALGILPARRPAGPIHHLKQSGYIRMQWDDALALIDVGRIGPDYLPGHAHADTLSFELAIRDRQVIVNRGTSCYGLSSRRAWERGTAAHSTVQVMNADSSETWGSFRVGRRARPLHLEVSDHHVACGHDGYRYLPAGPVHWRAWRRMERALQVEDRVSGRAPAVARYHLAPGLVVRRVSEDSCHIVDDGTVIARVRVDGAAMEIEDSMHAAGFGALTPAQTLVAQLRDARAVALWEW